jgi:CBS-domain-containing membrane protein
MSARNAYIIIDWETPTGNALRSEQFIFILVLVCHRSVMLLGVAITLYFKSVLLACRYPTREEVLPFDGMA